MSKPPVPVDNASDNSNKAKGMGTVGQSLKQHRQERDAKQQKKKPAEHLLPYLLYGELKAHRIRDVSGYKPRSYNLDKQLVDLINHLFVRYPVPAVLYPVCLDKNKVKEACADRFAFMHTIYRQWFITLAQGGSFSKAVKGVMTSKEASLFLKGGPNRLVHENVWLVKMQVADVPACLHNLLLDRILTRHYFDDPGGRLMELIRLYARYHKGLDKNTLHEVTDFLAWKLDNDPAFSMKGRTAGSMVKLANEWHVLIQKAKLGSNIEWDGFNIPYWSMEEWGHSPTLWEVVELRNNRELMNEGRKQKHCVYGYVGRCVEKRCSVYSLRQYTLRIVGMDEAGKPVKQPFGELTRLTEVTVKATSGQPPCWGLATWSVATFFTTRSRFMGVRLTLDASQHSTPPKYQSPSPALGQLHD